MPCRSKRVSDANLAESPGTHSLFLAWLHASSGSPFRCLNAAFCCTTQLSIYTSIWDLGVGYGMARPSEDIEYDVVFLKGRSQAMQISILGIDIGRIAAALLV